MAASEDISAYWCCSAAPIITFQAPKRYSVRTLEKENALQGSETSRTAIEELRKDLQYGGLQSKILSLFHLGKSHFCSSQEKNFHFLFCSQAKTVTWQLSIANNKHQQNFASYRSGYTSWSLSFPLYFGCLSLQSASYSGQGLSTTLVTTYATSVKRNVKLCVQINIDFWPSWKVWFPKWQTSLKNENTQVSLLTQQTKITHTHKIFPNSTVTFSLAELMKVDFLWICHP